MESRTEKGGEPMLKLKNLNLQVKLFLLTGVTTFLMWLGLTTVGVRAIQSSYEKEVDHIVRQTISQSSLYVSTEFRNVISLVHYALLSDSLQQALRLPVENSNRYISIQSAAMPILDQLRLQSDLIDSAALITKDAVFQNSIYPAGYDLAALMDEAGSDRLIYWSNKPTYNPSTKHWVLPVVMRIPTGDFTVKNEAYIALSLDADYLFDYIQSTENELNCALILHDGTTVIYGSEDTFADRGSDGVLESDTPMEVNDWSLCCILDKDTLYDGQNRAVGFIVIISLCIMALCLLFATLIAREISRPVRRLTEAAEKIAAGDYSAAVHLTGTDELGVLGRAFNDMTAQIRRSITALEEKTPCWWKRRSRSVPPKCGCCRRRSIPTFCIIPLIPSTGTRCRIGRGTSAMWCSTLPRCCASPCPRGRSISPWSGSSSMLPIIWKSKARSTRGALPMRSRPTPPL